jgi:hypothetical protein
MPISYKLFIVKTTKSKYYSVFCINNVDVSGKIQIYLGKFRLSLFYILDTNYVNYLFLIFFSFFL